MYLVIHASKIHLTCSNIDIISGTETFCALVLIYTLGEAVCTSYYMTPACALASLLHPCTTLAADRG